MHPLIFQHNSWLQRTCTRSLVASSRRLCRANDHLGPLPPSPWCGLDAFWMCWGAVAHCHETEPRCWLSAHADALLSGSDEVALTWGGCWVETPLKTAEVTAAGEKVKVMSFLRGEEDVSSVHWQRRMARWTRLKRSGFNTTSLEDFSYDLGSTSAVLVCSLFVKRGQRGYGNSWDVRRSAKHPMTAPWDWYGERSPPISELL